MSKESTTSTTDESQVPAWANKKRTSSTDTPLVDFSHENEPDISIFSNPTSASISEIWGQYPFKPKCQVDWDIQVKSAAENIAGINPYIPHKQPNEEIDAVEAVNWIKGQFGQVDFRPKLFDNVTKTYILCLQKSHSH